MSTDTSTDRRAEAPASPEVAGSRGAPAAAGRDSAAVRAGAAADRFTDVVGGAVSRVFGGLVRVGTRRPRLPRLRLLPAMIFVSVLMLGVRIGDLWTHLTVEQALDAGRAGLAQEAPEAPDEAAEAMENQPAPTDDAGPGDTAADTLPTEGADPVSSLLAGLDASGAVEPGQLALLEDLAERRAELERRARALDEREALLAASERRLDQKMTEIAAARDEIRALLGELDEQSAERIRNLAAIYEAMRPGDAAAIFNGLEMSVILSVMEHMRQQKSAPILAGMDPIRAREVTAELAKRRDIAADVANGADGGAGG